MSETLAMFFCSCFQIPLNLVHQLGCLDVKRDANVWMVASQKLCDLFEARLVSAIHEEGQNVWLGPHCVV